MKLSRELKAGIVALVVFGIAIWGFNFLKGKNIFKPTNEYYVVYEDITGLIESGYVYYRGHNVGNISRLDFDPANPEQFVVQFIVDSKIQIPKGSVAKAVQANPIASIKDLEITFSNSSEYYTPGDTLVAGYDKGIMGALEPIQNELEQTMISLTATLTALDSTLNEETQANIKSSIASLSASLASVRYMLSSSGTLTKTLENVESITGNLKDKNDKISSSIDNFANVTAALDSSDLQATILKLDSTLSATSSIMAKIDSGEGTAGLLINDSALYMNLAAASASLDTLLTDLEENPKKYVQFSLFGGKKEK